jgi:3D (Asp-Asp-Asp) domain-containing protein
MFGDYEEKQGRWSKKSKIRRVLIILGIVGAGCFVAIESRGGGFYRVDTQNLQDEGGRNKAGKTDDTGNCQKNQDGTFHCGPKELYEIKTTWFINYEVKKAVVTAYTCEDERCINAAGNHPIVGKSIACPRRFRLGSRVFALGAWKWTSVLESFGEGGKRTCDDRTNIKYDGRYDLFLPSRQEALKWGKKELEIIIENP